MTGKPIRVLSSHQKGIYISIEFYSTDTDQGTISVIRKDDQGYAVVKQIKVREVATVEA